MSGLIATPDKWMHSVTHIQYADNVLNVSALWRHGNTTPTSNVATYSAIFAKKPQAFM
jgi:hypothetical protein